MSAGQAKHDALITEAEAPVAEAQQKKAQILHDLDSERGVLQKEIEELHACERDHRARQKAYVEGRLAALEQTDPVDSAATQQLLTFSMPEDGNNAARAGKAA